MGVEGGIFTTQIDSDTLNTSPCTCLSHTLFFFTGFCTGVPLACTNWNLKEKKRVFNNEEKLQVMLKKIDRVTVVISTHTQEFFVVKLNSRSLFSKNESNSMQNSQKETVGYTHEWVSSLLHTTLDNREHIVPYFPGLSKWKHPVISSLSWCFEQGDFSRASTAAKTETGEPKIQQHPARLSRVPSNRDVTSPVVLAVITWRDAAVITGFAFCSQTS